MFPLVDGHKHVVTGPRHQRNARAILPVYNTAMHDRKVNFQIESVGDELNPNPSERQKRESLLKRRLIGAAIIIGLALLGLAFPVVI
jgi:hypothetical protein